MYTQLKVNLGKGHCGVKGHCEVNKDLQQKVIYKTINSIFLQLVLHLVFSSVTSANSFINSTVSLVVENHKHVQG